MPTQECVTYNIVNPGDIKAYIREFSYIDKAFNDTLYDHLQTALKNPIRKDISLYEELSSLPEDAPGWLRDKWGENAFHKFVPNDDLDKKVQKIRDWIKEAIVLKEEWLANVDSEGRPLKLLKLGDFDQALKEAEKAYSIRAQQVLDQKSESVYFNKDIISGDIETIIVFPNGYRFVRLMTAEALDQESEALGHCMGKGYYDRYLPKNAVLEKPDYIFVSLRNHRNHPLFSMKIWRYYNEISECRTKGDQPIPYKLLKYIDAFEKKTGIGLSSSELNKLGIIKVNEKRINLKDLPEGYVYLGDLTLDMYLPYVSLPKNLVIEGNLTTLAENIYVLPDDLTVNGRFTIRQRMFTDGQTRYLKETVYRGFNGPMEAEYWKRSARYGDWCLHREEGPAEILYDLSTGERTQESYYINGKEFIKNPETGMLEKIYPRSKGKIIMAPVSKSFPDGHNPMSFFAGE